jgi:homoserine O-acetyltransferase/O-succinyltransferase
MRSLLIALTLLITSVPTDAQEPPFNEQPGDFVAHDFQFEDGTSLPDITLHYVTLGTPRRDSNGHPTNAVLLLHGFLDTGRAFLTAAMRRELFAPGQPLDASRYFIVIPDGLGRGGSSKPSDGLRTKFPQYGFNDVVQAQYLLVTQGLHIDHLRLVLGTSMGGMQTWLWGEQYPKMMDGLMPIASQPVAMGGRNGFWRQMIVSAIRRDPDWNDGNYAAQPIQWLRAMPVFTLMTKNAARMQALSPTPNTATWSYDVSVYSGRQYDANDVLYWFESSWDYDPEAALGRIEAPLFALNFADDLTTPTDLGIMQRLVPRVRHGRFVEMPESEHSYGNQTTEHPEVWKGYLSGFLRTLP